MGKSRSGRVVTTTTGPSTATLAVAVRPEAIARHVIQRILNPRFLSYMASYDVATNICETLFGGRGGGGGGAGGDGNNGGRGVPRGDGGGSGGGRGVSRGGSSGGRIISVSSLQQDFRSFRCRARKEVVMVIEIGRCRLTVSKLVLKAPMISALEATI